MSLDSTNASSIEAEKSRLAANPSKRRRSANATQNPLKKNSSAMLGEAASDAPKFQDQEKLSQEQLVAEVKGIYAGLVMVEARCIEIDKQQADLAQADPSIQPKLNNEQWQALIALHRTILHEHHDFFLASQHPSASQALRRLASKYAMPARMWRHGIHSFLEFLRHRLPASLDHMLAFIYLAYSMMALLYETVPAFEDTWIECLGDLGRYRMAIEDDDIRDREVWTGVARHWYSKASDKTPTTGRLYHHLAILARPNALQQLFYYSKALCVQLPFTSARESILTLFEPVMNAGNRRGQFRLPALDTTFVKAHGLLFTGNETRDFDASKDEFLSLLDAQIGRVARKFVGQGCHISIANAVALLYVGSKSNILMRAIHCPEDGQDFQMEGAPGWDRIFENVRRLTDATITQLERIDANVLPFIIVTLGFLYHRLHNQNEKSLKILDFDFPWKHSTPGQIEDDQFPVPEEDDVVRSLPEDYAMRGLLWTAQYNPENWFKDSEFDVEERHSQLERRSMTDERKERMLWLACQISGTGRFIVYEGNEFRTDHHNDLPQYPIDHHNGLDHYPNNLNTASKDEDEAIRNQPQKSTKLSRDTGQMTRFLGLLKSILIYRLPFTKYLQCTWLST